MSATNHRGAQTTGGRLTKNFETGPRDVKPRYLAAASYHAALNKDGASRRAFKITGQATKPGK